MSGADRTAAGPARGDQPATPVPHVIVLGAGLAGLTAAGCLEAAGCRVTVLEKSRGAGGRMATRRAGDLRFDHGAPSFIAEDAAFARAVSRWCEAGTVQPWPARLAVVDDAQCERVRPGPTRYVALPGMSGLCRVLAGGLQDCRFRWRATGLRRENGDWVVTGEVGEDGEPGEARADTLLLTLPAPQSAALLAGAGAALAMVNTPLQPCWSVMAELDAPLIADVDGAWVTVGELAWVAREASKPGRPAAEAWTLLATPDWSARHLEADATVVCEALLQAARELPGASAFTARRATAHRWRYAQVAGAPRPGVAWDEGDRLAVAGDWCLGGGVEGAWLAGMAAARAIRGACGDDADSRPRHGNGS